MLDIPRIFTITESEHRIHNPYTAAKFATLGSALRLKPETRVLDLGSGSGEMLCTWARDHAITGTGIDMSPLFCQQAEQRARELGVGGRVCFIHADAAGYVAEEKVDLAACIGATWIGGGVAGTIELLSRSLCPGGMILVGEPYWLRLPPTEDIAKGCGATSIADFHTLPGLVASFSQLGYDVVEMVLAVAMGAFGAHALRRDLPPGAIDVAKAVHHDVGALLGQLDGDAQPDADGGAGDEGRLAFQCAHESLLSEIE